MVNNSKKILITGRYFRETVDAYLYYNSFDIHTIVHLSMMYRRIRYKSKLDETSIEKIFRATFKRINNFDCPWKFYIIDQFLLHGTPTQISKLLTCVIDQYGTFFNVV